MISGGWGMRTIGLNKVLKRLAASTVAYNELTRAGLIRAGFWILRESNKIVPVDTGNLRSSGFVIWDKMGVKGAIGNPTGDTFRGKNGSKLSKEHGRKVSVEKAKLAHILGGTRVEVGYTAYYALYVHENPTAKHKQGKSYKFLEKAVARKGEIMKVIKGVKL